MPKIKYQDITLRGAALALVETCNRIVEEYQAQGFELTLRQIYYQLVALDLFPDDRKFRNIGGDKWVRDENGTKNATPNYKWLGTVVNDGRMAGLIDWDAIVDRTRNLKSISHWETPSEIMEAVAGQFRLDKWRTQRYRPEVWIEKDALIGVIERVCEELDVPYFSCRGYTSQSEMWGAAMRFVNYYKADQQPYVIHLGDHDPSGKDMSRDIEDRLNMFISRHVKAGEGIGFSRIALNMDQVRKYNPPPNPAKLTDSRCTGYIEQYGDSSWELDALKPNVLAALIRSAVMGLRKKKEWDSIQKTEETHRELLGKAAERWEDVAEMLT